MGDIPWSAIAASNWRDVLARQRWIKAGAAPCEARESLPGSETEAGTQAAHASKVLERCRDEDRAPR